MNLARMIEQNAMRIPKNPAVINETVHWSWREFNLKVNQFANALSRLGVGKNDRVAMYLPNSPEYLVVYFAIAKLGATAVPFNIMFKSSEITYIINNSRAKVLVAAAAEAALNVEPIRSQLSTLEHVILVGEYELEDTLTYTGLLAGGSEEFTALECAEDDVVTILYTSGTTGQPKGAMLTHANFYRNAELNGSYTLHINDQDIFLTGTPFCHIFFVLAVLGPMFKGAATVTMPRFFPDKALELISKYKVTHFAGVPTMYIYMLQTYKADPEKYDLSSWRFAQAAGAAMPAEYIGQIERAFQIGYCECYGSTETSSTCTYGRLGHGKAGSIGLPAEMWEIKIVDEDNQEVPVGEIGEITVKGPGVFKGYWDMPEATAAAFSGEWFHTGDLGREDEDGYLYIVDRKKDMLICGGYNIYPREIEEVLYAHPAVLEAAVVGIQDAAKGEIPKAYITLKPNAGEVSPEDIIAYCKERMAAYKVPRVVEFLNEFPKNASGKILKRSLRELEAEIRPTA
ncbi:class I adenylate-forming enzyme family protein [Paradesulfitobacterium ferrireducens]|uniref:class I adenylate-forming enzyme family protein n=1 Tax=Paradesulfitobacterium ferrireducens TaxID=2816476 RepID=UPI001A8DDC90|nr:long-chain-fatty-acid--CoA ligase [Paradesulfitobacterium ferrireducens]